MARGAGGAGLVRRNKEFWNCPFLFSDSWFFMKLLTKEKGADLGVFTSTLFNSSQKQGGGGKREMPKKKNLETKNHDRETEVTTGSGQKKQEKTQ